MVHGHRQAHQELDRQARLRPRRLGRNLWAIPSCPCSLAEWYATDPHNATSRSCAWHGRQAQGNNCSAQSTAENWNCSGPKARHDSHCEGEAVRASASSTPAPAKRRRVEEVQVQLQVLEEEYDGFEEEQDVEDAGGDEEEAVPQDEDEDLWDPGALNYECDEIGAVEDAQEEADEEEEGEGEVAEEQAGEEAEEAEDGEVEGEAEGDDDVIALDDDEDAADAEEELDAEVADASFEIINEKDKHDGRHERLLLTRLRKGLTELLPEWRFELEAFGSYVTELGLPKEDSAGRSGS